MMATGLYSILNALGWSLIDSIWQLGLLWVVYVVIVTTRSGFTSAQRHDLALLIVYIGVSGFLIQLFLSWGSPYQTYSLLSVWNNRSGRLPADALVNGFSLAYIIVFLYQITQFTREFGRVRHMRRAHDIKPYPALRNFVSQVGKHMGIRSEVILMVSAKVDTPLTVGFWKPVIYLPISLLTQLEPTQLEAILLHELAHIKRNDYLHNILVSISEAILCFNPFARALVRVIRQEREHSCDDQVLELSYNPIAYAEALLLLGESRMQRIPAFAMTATTGPGKPLLLRIRRLLNPPQAYTPALKFRSSLWMGAAILFCLVAGDPKSPTVFEQTKNAPVTASTSPIPGKNMVSRPRHTPSPLYKKTRTVKSRLQVIKKDQREELVAVLPLKASQVKIAGNGFQIPVTTTATLQKRDYVIPQIQRPVEPEPKELITGLPYIPKNSFDFPPPANTAPPATPAPSITAASAAVAESLRQVDRLIRQELSGSTWNPERIQKLALIKIRLSQWQQEFRQPKSGTKKIVEL